MLRARTTVKRVRSTSTAASPKAGHRWGRHSDRMGRRLTLNGYWLRARLAQIDFAGLDRASQKCGVLGGEHVVRGDLRLELRSKLLS